MPELPEVETSVNGIKPWLEGKRIKQICIHNDALRWQIPAELAHNYTHLKITKIARRAKYILIHLDDSQTIIIHLGMSGSLSLLQNNSTLLKHDHFEMIMHDGTRLRYNDPRRFGCILVTKDYQKHRLMVKLGPEPLSSEFDGHYLKQKAKNKTQAVKNFIMDGKIVVGVGNIYASEALYSAGIKPSKSAKKVSLQKYNLLAKAIKTTLAKAIQAGGTTLKDFHNADGKAGYFAQELKVYGKENQPCPHCSAPIVKMIIGQRSSFYCKKCQS